MWNMFQSLSSWYYWGWHWCWHWQNQFCSLNPCSQPLITYSSQCEWVCVDTELSWSILTFTSISTDCTMYTGAAAVMACGCLISYCTSVLYNTAAIVQYYFFYWDLFYLYSNSYDKLWNKMRICTFLKHDYMTENVGVPSIFKSK